MPRQKIKTAKVVIVSGGECLLLQRSGFCISRPGEWDLPGGKFDKDQDRTMLDTAVREPREETGIKLDPSVLQIVQANSYSEGKKDFYKEFYMAELALRPNVKLDPFEHTEHLWAADYKVEELGLPERMFEAISKAYERLRQTV